MPIPPNGRQSDLVGSAELLRDIPHYNAILAHGRQKDLAVMRLAEARPSKCEGRSAAS